MLRPSFACLPLSLLCACSQGPSAAAPGAVVWARSFGQISVTGAPAIAADADGNVAVAGAYDGDPPVFDDTKLPQWNNAFVASLGEGGRTRWVFSIAGSGEQIASGVGVAANGDVIAAGRFDGTLQLGASTKIEAVSGDMFLVALDRDGKPRWHKHFSNDLGGPAGVGTVDPSAGLAISPRGDIVVAGTFTGTVGFGGAPLHPDATADPMLPSYSFIASLDASGAPRWAIAMEGTSASVRAIAADGAGDVVIAGAYSGIAKLGEHTIINPTVDMLGHLHGFVGKISRDGDPRWLVDVSDWQGAEAFGVAADAHGDVFAVGSCASTLEVQGLSKGPDCAAFILALTEDGAPRWLETVASDLDATAVIAAGGDVIVTGSQGQGQPDFGAGPLPPRDANGFYVADLDGKGKALSSFAFGAASAGSWGQAITALPGQDVAVAGRCAGNLGIGGIDPNDRSALDGLFVARVAR